MHYRKDIQGLRALAVLFVFIFHLNPKWLPGGFIGVDVFFVISGFLVGSILLRKIDNGSFSFTGFYIARIKRIVPAYYFMLLCTATAATVIIIGNDIDVFRRTLKHALAFNADYCFATMNSYFGMQQRHNPLLHTWTIATEMKFYLLLPLLLFFTPKKYVLQVLAGIIVMLLFYSVYQIQFHHKLPAEYYYSLPIRIPEFLIGVFIGALGKRLTHIPPAIKVTAGCSGIFILMYCALFFSYKTSFPGVMAILPCAGAALLLLSDTGPVSALLSKKPFVAVGAVSYSIYLWHWPVMALIRYYYDINYFSHSQALIIMVLTALFSIISYVFIENIFRAAKFKMLVIAGTPVTAILLVVFIYARPVNQYFSFIPAEYSGAVFGVKSHNIDFVETLGDTLAAPQIFLMGNSHALSLKAYFDYIGKRQHFSFRTLTTNTYFPIEGLDAQEALNKRYGDYAVSKELVPTANKEIANSKIIIIVTSSWTYINAVKPAIRKLIANLKDGQQLILVGTFPILNKDPLKANRGYVKSQTARQNFLVKFKAPDTDIMQLADKYPNVHYFDLSKGEVYNDAPFYNDTLMYYDRKHLNEYGAIALAKHTEAQFMALLNALPR